MKTTRMIAAILLAASTCAQAMECKYDNRAVDGNAASFILTKEGDTYSVKLVQDSTYMNPAPARVTEIASANCFFSKKFSLLGECRQVEGPRGQVYTARTSLEYSDFRAKDRVALRVVITSGTEQVAAQSFPLETCVE